RVVLGRAGGDDDGGDQGCGEQSGVHGVRQVSPSAKAGKKGAARRTTSALVSRSSELSSIVFVVSFPSSALSPSVPRGWARAAGSASSTASSEPASSAAPEASAAGDKKHGEKKHKKHK